MKVKEFIETMNKNCPMVLESPKLRIIKKGITIRLYHGNYEKYADKEIVSWSICPTRVNVNISNKGMDLYGYIILEVENED